MQHKSLLAALCATVALAGCAASTSSSPSPTGQPGAEPATYTPISCGFIASDAYAAYFPCPNANPESVLAYNTGEVWASHEGIPVGWTQECSLSAGASSVTVYFGEDDVTARDVCTYYETQGWIQ